MLQVWYLNLLNTECSNNFFCFKKKTEIDISKKLVEVIS